MIRSLKKLFGYLIDLVFPKDPEVLAIEQMSVSDFLNHVQLAGETDGFNALFDYRDKLARKGVWEVKYRGNKKILNLLSTILYDRLLEEVTDKEQFENFCDPLLVPVPISAGRLRERGFNQTELICKKIFELDRGQNFQLTLALKKIRETCAQTTLERKERLENLMGAFVADSLLVHDRNIVVVDDVATTGATFAEAKRALGAAGAKKIFCISIAH